MIKRKIEHLLMKEEIVKVKNKAELDAFMGNNKPERKPVVRTSGISTNKLDKLAAIQKRGNYKTKADIELWKQQQAKNKGGN